MNFENSKDLLDLDLVRYLSVTLSIAFWIGRRNVVWLSSTGRSIHLACNRRMLNHDLFERKVFKAEPLDQTPPCCLLEIECILPSTGSIILGCFFPSSAYSVEVFLFVRRSTLKLTKNVSFLSLHFFLKFSPSGVMFHQNSKFGTHFTVH